MSELSEGDRFLLEQVRAGEADGWTELVERYQGRLTAFARGRLRGSAEAEDLVQETFLGFMRSLDRFRGDASIETYLFTILRRKIIDHLRGQKVATTGLQPTDGDERADKLAQLPTADLTASAYARNNEQVEVDRALLAGALSDVIERHRQSLNFEVLQIIELLFYAQARNQQVAQLVGVTEQRVALIKHRCLKQVQAALLERQGDGSGAGEREIAETLLTEAWEERRPSCPKRSTIGAYLLGSLDDAWRDYVRFHLETLGCRFCKANHDDLQQQAAAADAQRALRDRILQSTVGFFKRDSG